MRIFHVSWDFPFSPPVFRTLPKLQVQRRVGSRQLRQLRERCHRGGKNHESHDGPAPHEATWAILEPSLEGGKSRQEMAMSFHFTRHFLIFLWWI